MTTNDSLLNDINVFCEKNDISPSGFGRMFLNNPNFVWDLGREGFDPKLSTVNKLKLRMKTYKPKGAKHAKQPTV